MDANDSYVSTSSRMDYHYQTVPERMALQAKLHPENEVYVFVHPDGRRNSVTAGKLNQLSTSLAKSLINLGIQKGDVVAVALANDLDCLVSLLAIICTGATALSVIVKDEDGANVRDMLKKTKATCLILDPGQEGQEVNACMNFIDEVDQDGTAKSTSVPSLNYFVSTDRVDNMDCMLLQDLIHQSHPACELPRLDPEDTMVFFTTSGSTGLPKLVPMSHHSAMITGYHLQASMNYDADTDVIYSERRFAWIGGFPFMFLLDCVKVVTKTVPLSSYKDHCTFTYRTIVNEGCTVACLFPPTVAGLLDVVPDDAHYILKTIQTGGLPVEHKCMETIGKITREVVNMYGSSEAGFLSSARITDMNDFIDYSTGVPHQGVEIKVVGEDGLIVKRGILGTIYVRSPCLFREYFRDEGSTQAVLTQSHWMNTDDIGIIDATGNVIVKGRGSDIILQGGRYFIPSTMESFVKKHPDVYDAIVVPVPDDVKFELVCACVIPKVGSVLSSDDIFSFFKQKHLTSAGEAFSVTYPELVLIFDEFPKLYTGKPDKKTLKLEAIERAKQLKK